jgi:putative membrane protein
VRRGLFTNTETSLERRRVRGLEVAEPLGLRIAGAGRLSAVVTGLSRSERSSTQLVPPAPRAVVEEVGADLLGDATALRLPLRRHGPAARRRRYTRAVAASLVPAGLVALLCLTTGLPWWTTVPALLPLPFGLLLAADRYRRLGHGLTDDYLVVRSGTFRGRRAVLQRSGIIGWNVQQSWFQRRAGLATLVATTAAGQQAYAAIDIPEREAIALADAATPGLLTPFLA